MVKKTFKSLDEQIQILRSKGLIIKDEEKTKEVLLRENYFFISGYRHLFMLNNNRYFIFGTTFEELYATFLFDRGIRNIMFKYILVVENNIKSIISYQLSKKYGFKEEDYLNTKNYNQDILKQRQVNDVIEKMKRQIRVNGRKHKATLHYINNYGYIPMWILVKVLSFGIIAELYAILKETDQSSISNFYELDIDALKTNLYILANFRNLCAHEDILYDHRTQKNIKDTNFHYLLDIPKYNDEYIYGKNDLFALVIILKQMLTDVQFREFIYEVGYEIDILDGRVNTVSLIDILNKIGFPSNWRDIVNF